MFFLSQLLFIKLSADQHGAASSKAKKKNNLKINFLHF